MIHVYHVHVTSSTIPYVLNMFICKIVKYNTSDYYRPRSREITHLVASVRLFVSALRAEPFHLDLAYRVTWVTFKGHMG